MLAFVFNDDILFHAGFLGILSWRVNILLIYSRMKSKFNVRQSSFELSVIKSKPK